MDRHLRIAPHPDEGVHHRAPSDSIRVVLADDHALMRRSLRGLLDGEPGLEVVGEASDLSSVLREVRSQLPEVLVFDPHMPNSLNLDAIRRIRQRAPATRIVVLAMDDDAVFARHALDAGAIGFVLKDEADSDLPQAVHEAAGGRRYVSPRINLPAAAAQDSPADEVPIAALTQREFEVLRLTALGHTIAEIASRLRVSPRTVENDRAHIHRKLRTSSRSELVAYALRRGMLKPAAPSASGPAASM